MSQRLRIIWRVDKEIPDGCLSSGVICYFQNHQNCDWQMAFVGCFVPPSFDNGLGLRAMVLPSR